VYLDSDEGPSVAAQRNVRALVELRQTLKFDHFYIVPISATGSALVPSETLLGSNAFRTAVDFNRWKGYIYPSSFDSFRDLVDNILGSQQPHPKDTTAEYEHLDKHDLDNMFRKHESEYLAKVQVYMSNAQVRLSKSKANLSDAQADLSKTQSDLTTLRGELAKVQGGLVQIQNRLAKSQRESAELKTALDAERSSRIKAIKATAAAEDALKEMTIRHNVTRSQFNLDLDDNEMRNIVHQFNVLNKSIEKFCIDIAATVPNDLLERNANTGSCKDPGGLKQLLVGDSDASVLILKSRNGVPMPTQFFLQMFVGAVICQTLHTCVFRPFYPLDDSLPESALQDPHTSVYNQIRLRGEQTLFDQGYITTHAFLTSYRQTNAVGQVANRHLHGTGEARPKRPRTCAEA
jgi:hypothetical protein